MSFKFVKVENFFSIEVCEYLRSIMDEWVGHDLPTKPDPMCPDSLAFPRIFNDESLMITEKVEGVIGLDLWPTYTYARIYNKGDDLPAHVDRWACEYSMSVNLGPSTDVWPIYLRETEYDESPTYSMELNIGDAGFYKGTDIFHWREELKTDGPIYQAFFHYVDKNGPHASHKHDRQEVFFERRKNYKGFFK